MILFHYVLLVVNIKLLVDLCEMSLIVLDWRSVLMMPLVLRLLFGYIIDIKCKLFISLIVFLILRNLELVDFGGHQIIV
jgi:hypothetical protein